MSVQTLTKKMSSLSKVHVKKLIVTSVVRNFPAFYGTQYHVHTPVHSAHPTLNKIQIFINISYSLINTRWHQSQLPNKNLHKQKKLLCANKWDMRLEFLLLISGQTTDKGQNPHLHMKNLIFLHHTHSS